MTDPRPLTEEEATNTEGFWKMTGVVGRGHVTYPNIDALLHEGRRSVARLVAEARDLSDFRFAAYMGWWDRD